MEHLRLVIQSAHAALAAGDVANANAILEKKCGEVMETQAGKRMSAAPEAGDRPVVLHVT
jgi:hypothetical protein